MSEAASKEQTREVVLSILAGIAPEVDPAQVAPDADLRRELDIDSIDFLRFVVQLHDRLGVDVPEADYRLIRTLDGCVAYLEARRAAPVPAGAPPPR